MRTIKELADALGVSKTAIRKYMNEEFRGNHVETDRNGVLTIDDEGCKLIAETMGIDLESAETNANQEPETSENSGNIVIPAVVWALLEEQLRQKDEQLRAKDAQLEAKDAQIADLTATVRTQAESLQAAQALHAGTMHQILPDGGECTVEPVVEMEPAPTEKRGFWAWLKGRG